MKKIKDIELLLKWACQDELPKQENSAWSAWRAINQYSTLGTRINSQNWDWEPRLPVILGPPHPDSLAIAKRISELPSPFEGIVTHHAVMGSRPDWLPGSIRVYPIRDGSRVRITGKCEGKNRYSPGSYCPLEYRPSLAKIDAARLEYSQWHAALTTLARTLKLADHIASGPEAPAAPWLVDSPAKRVIFRLTPAAKAVLA